MRMFYVVLGLLAAIFLTGCAAGKRVEYRGSSEFESRTVKGSVVVLGTSDARPYVLNGDKQSSFVGLSRSLYGIPFGVLTTSGEPLADEIGSLVAGALRKNGASVTQVKIPLGTSVDGRNALFKAANNPRYHFIEIQEWTTDTYFNVTLKYDVSLSVLDSRGSQLVKKSVKGEDKLGTRPDRANLAIALSSIFGGLMNDSEIVAASDLNQDSTQMGTSTPQAVIARDEKPNACSVEQILQMKKLGLSQERITEACK